MELYCFELGPIFIPMIETGNGQNVTTIKMAARAVGMSIQSVYNALLKFPSRFNKLSLTKSEAKEFLLENKVIFELARARTDLRLLTESDILELALMSNNWEFRDKFKDFLHARAMRHYVHKDVFLKVCAERDETMQRALVAEELLATCLVKLEALEQRMAKVEYCMPSLDKITSCAGMQLNEAKKLKQIKGDN